MIRGPLAPLARHRDDTDPQLRWMWDGLVAAWIPELDPSMVVGGELGPRPAKLSNPASAGPFAGRWPNASSTAYVSALITAAETTAAWKNSTLLCDFHWRSGAASGFMFSSLTQSSTPLSSRGIYLYGDSSNMWAAAEPNYAQLTTGGSTPGGGRRVFAVTRNDFASGSARLRIIDGLEATPDAMTGGGATESVYQWYCGRGSGATFDGTIFSSMAWAKLMNARELAAICADPSAPFRWRRRRTYAYVSSGPPPIVVACGVARAVARAVPATPTLGAVTTAAAPARARAHSVAATTSLGTSTPSCAPARATGRAIASTLTLGAASPLTAPVRAVARSTPATLSLGAVAPATGPARARGAAVPVTITLGTVTCTAGIARARAIAIGCTALTGNVVLCGVGVARARSVSASLVLGGVTSTAGTAVARGRAAPATTTLGTVTPPCDPARARGTATPAALQLGSLSPATSPARAIARAVPTLPLASGAWVFVCGVGVARASSRAATVGIGVLSPQLGIARAIARAVPALGEPAIVQSRVVRAVVRGGHALRAEVTGGHVLRATIRGGVS